MTQSKHTQKKRRRSSISHTENQKITKQGSSEADNLLDLLAATVMLKETRREILNYSLYTADTLTILNFLMSSILQEFVKIPLLLYHIHLSAYCWTSRLLSLSLWKLWEVLELLTRVTAALQGHFILWRNTTGILQVLYENKLLL